VFKRVVLVAAVVIPWIGLGLCLTVPAGGNRCVLSVVPAFLSRPADTAEQPGAVPAGRNVGAVPPGTDLSSVTLRPLVFRF
jgi:hypothetical protein